MPWRRSEQTGATGRVEVIRPPYLYLRMPIALAMGAIAPSVIPRIGMMVMPPPCGMVRPAMPSKTVPPARRICRVGKSGGADRQGGERRQDEFPHRFTSVMLVSCWKNGEQDRFNPFNQLFFTDHLEYGFHCGLRVGGPHHLAHHRDAMRSGG